MMSGITALRAVKDSRASDQPRISATICGRSSASTPHTFISLAARRAPAVEVVEHACMAGSSRLRSSSCSARHSRRSRAKMPAGSNCCSRSTRLELALSRPAARRPSEIGGEIARLVERVDEVQADQPSSDRPSRRQLRRRCSRRGTAPSGFDGCSRRRPRAGHGSSRSANRRRPARRAGAPSHRRRVLADVAEDSPPAAPPAADRRRRSAGRLRRAARLVVAGFVALQQRILLQLGLDEAASSAG